MAIVAIVPGSRSSNGLIDGLALSKLRGHSPLPLTADNENIWQAPHQLVWGAEDSVKLWHSLKGNQGFSSDESLRGSILLDVF